LENPRRILIIRPSALGDVARTVPVLASLRARYPNAEIDWLVQAGFEPVIASHPALTRPLIFPRHDISLRRLWRADARRTLADFLLSLRAPRYDLVIDCQGLGRSGLFARATRAPRRIGFANARELGWLGVNERHPIPRTLHTVDRMLALLECAGINPLRDLRLYSHESDRVAASEIVATDSPILLAPTSRWPGKRWPPERFAHLAAALLDRGFAPIVLVGGPSERDQCAPLLTLAARRPGLIDLVGRTPVGLLLAIIERARLVIANDSAAVHIAVGFDRPLVALYGPTRTDLVGPYRRERDVIQASTPPRGNRHKDATAGRAAMNAITLDQVLDAALARLMGAPR
jgi:lipopolysaccharide heptosyltransferase I